MLDEFRAELTLRDTDRRVVVGSEDLTVRIAVRNISRSTWPHDGAHPVRFSSHVLVGDTVVVFDGPRSPLPCDLAPGDVIECPVAIPFHYDIDEATIAITLVQEGVAWFDAADPDQIIRIHVERTRTRRSID